MEEPSEALSKMMISTRDNLVESRASYPKRPGVEKNNLDGMGYCSEVQQISVTKAKGSFMDLPPEVRLKIYPHLLVVEEGITLSASQRAKGNKPSVAILQACCTINKEGTPILYGKNRFTVFLDLTPGPAYLICFPMSLRWSSIPHVETIAYKTKTMALSSFDAKFVVSGTDIVERFTAQDIQYSPVSPDNYLALNIKDWASREVVQATMSAFHNSMSAAITGNIPLP